MSKANSTNQTNPCPTHGNAWCCCGPNWKAPDETTEEKQVKAVIALQSRITVLEEGLKTEQENSDHLDALLKLKVDELATAVEAGAKMRGALERIKGMCGEPTIEKCLCGRPNGLSALVACANKALADSKPPELPEGKEAGR